MSGLGALEGRETVRVTMRDGTLHEGRYEARAGMHFVHLSGMGRSGLLPAVAGPLDEAAVTHVDVVEDRATVMENARLALYGKPVPGREPVTRDDYEHRLGMLARMAVCQENWQRQVQLRRQFDALADRIALAGSKREWIIREARFRRHSNEEPTMAAIWVQDCASPSMLRRPRPQDFDPDPINRRARVPVPAHVARDPRSIPNMLSALRRAGLHVILSRLGYPEWDRAQFIVKMPVKGRAQFCLDAFRRADGAMRWNIIWDGNASASGLARKRAAERTADFSIMVETLLHGKREPK